MSYTAKTVKQLRQEGGSLAKKLAIEFGLIESRLNVFISVETTGTGSSQDVAHGLGSTPTAVFIVLTEFGTAQNPNVTEGTHDATNVKVTVASNTVKFKVIAWV